MNTLYGITCVVEHKNTTENSNITSEQSLEKCRYICGVSLPLHNYIE